MQTSTKGSPPEAVSQPGNTELPAPGAKADYDRFPLRPCHDRQGANGMIALFLRSFKCGRRGLMQLAHLARELDPNLASIVADWDRMTSSLQNAADLDALCEAHGVDPAHFIGVVGEAQLRFRSNVSILVAALNLPAVVAASVRAAKKKTGVADRKMLFEHAGL